MSYSLGPPLLQFPPNQPGYAIIRQEILEGSSKVYMDTGLVEKPLDPPVNSLLPHGYNSTESVDL